MATEKPVLSKYRDRMDKAISTLKDEFSSLLTGRASAGLLDQVMVDAYGSTVPLNTVGSVSVPEPRSISVNIWDRGLVVSVEKAIRNAGLGLNPVVDGQSLRVPIPPLTEERRKDLSKHVAHEGENAKVAIRNVRRDAMQHVKDLLKERKVTEDEERRAEEDIQKLTDKFVKDVDGVVQAKEKELMAV